MALPWAGKLIHPKSPPRLRRSRLAGLAEVTRPREILHLHGADRQAQTFNGERLGWFLGPPRCRKSPAEAGLVKGYEPRRYFRGHDSNCRTFYLGGGNSRLTS
jgi:hypothetical protein